MRLVWVVIPLILFGIVGIENADASNSSDESISSPRQQMNEGIFSHEITCKEGLELIFKPNDSPACVKQSTAEKLIQRGWAIDKKDAELVVFPLSEELALEKAFALTNDLYSSGDCGLETHQSEYIVKTVIDGFAFYEIDLGPCHGEFIQGGLLACHVSVSINAMNQTDSSFEVICYDG